MNSRVVFDLGLRYDRDGIGKENNFAPRLGLVVTPTDSDRTVVRGGVGLFYDKIPLNIGAFEQYQSLRREHYCDSTVSAWSTDASSKTLLLAI